MVCPTLTLMLSAKPWMLESPAPLTSHVLCGVPGRQFSASIALPEAEQLAQAGEADLIIQTRSKRKGKMAAGAFEGFTIVTPRRTLARVRLLRRQNLANTEVVA